MIPQERIRKFNRELAQIRQSLAIVERLIAPGIISLSNAVGDGHPQKGDGPSSGISDPVGAAIVRASPAIELDYQLKISWVVLLEMPNTIAALLRQARTLTPQAIPIVAACSAGLHLHGYQDWGRKDSNGAPVACEEIGESDRGGLCLGCGKRRSRWQAENRATDVRVP